MTLTDTQTAALEGAGREIARGWLDVCDADTGSPDPSYDFGEHGDWRYVRTVAVQADVDWDLTDPQPPLEIHDALWAAVRRGYQAELAR